MLVSVMDWYMLFRMQNCKCDIREAILTRYMKRLIPILVSEIKLELELGLG